MKKTDVSFLAIMVMLQFPLIPCSWITFAYYFLGNILKKLKITT